jgi:hypothetical protein
MGKTTQYGIFDILSVSPQTKGLLVETFNYLHDMYSECGCLGVELVLDHQYNSAKVVVYDCEGVPNDYFESVGYDSFLLKVEEFVLRKRQRAS